MFPLRQKAIKCVANELEGDDSDLMLGCLPCTEALAPLGLVGSQHPKGLPTEPCFLTSSLRLCCSGSWVQSPWSVYSIGLDLSCLWRGESLKSKGLLESVLGAWHAENLLDQRRND